MSKGLYLTLPEKLYRKLSDEKEEEGYSSLQELILSILRPHYFTHASSPTSLNGTKRGRPKDFDLARVVSRRRIFSKRGKGARWKW